MPGAARPPERSPRAQLAVPGALAVLDVPAVRRWALLTRSVFAARRVEIDALNVFPVPDGDTGTNLFLTFDGGVERMLAHDPHGAGDLLAAFAKALLWTARGNSGVILSQLARGLAEAAGGLVHGDDLVDRRVEGEVEVGAGVAVGHREDVEGVDLGAPSGEGRPGQQRPVTRIGGSEEVRHAPQGNWRVPPWPGGVLVRWARLGYACPVACLPLRAAEDHLTPHP